MHDIVWHGDSGLILGLDPRPDLNPDAPLPESVEAQVATLVHNLEALLARAGGHEPAVLGVRFNLTQFQRFHKRAARALDKELDPASPMAISWIGVTDLPGDALVTLDAWLRRDS